MEQGSTFSPQHCTQRGQWEPGSCGVLPGGHKHFALARLLNNTYSLRNQESGDAVEITLLFVGCEAVGVSKVEMGWPGLHH